MIKIINGFSQTRDVNVQWKNPNGQWSTPIPGGGSHQPGTGINSDFLFQAFKQNQGPINSSIKISPLPNNHSINILYNTADKTWEIGKGVKFLNKCPTNVNVEIGP